MGFNFALSVLTLLGQLLADILYAFVDPRISLSIKDAMKETTAASENKKIARFLATCMRFVVKNYRAL